jgi:hypothetical protein
VRFAPSHNKQLNNAFPSQPSAHSRHGETIGIFSFGKLAFYKPFLYPRKKEFCMKNLVKQLAIIALVAVIGFSFTACPDGGGGGGGGSTHTHTYSEAWSSNATQHWHECTANDGAKSDVANHTGNPCSVCNYLNMTTAIPLTLNTWADGNLPANGEQLFTFTATADRQYIHVSFGALTDLYVQVYDSNGVTVGSRSHFYSSDIFGNYVSRTVSTGQTYYIKVTPYGSGSGTYKIAFNTGGIPPSVTPTALTLNTWANGNLPVNGQQWFTFTATASTQYIHVSFGTLTIIQVWVYDSSGATVGGGAGLSSSQKYTAKTVSTGQTYYIMVSPRDEGSSGTYQIGFNTSYTAP